MATKANVTEIQRNESPLLYQIQRTSGPSGAQLKTINELSQKKIKEFRDAVARRPKNPVQQFMDLVVPVSPIFNPSAGSAFAHTLPLPLPGANSSWRLITPPYEGIEGEGQGAVATEWGNLSTYATGTSDERAEFGISIISPARVHVSISPAGTYLAGYNFNTAVREILAEVFIALTVYEDKGPAIYVNGQTVSVFSLQGDFPAGHKLYWGNLADLADSAYGPLSPISFDMEANTKYHVYLKILSYLTGGPGFSGVLTAGVAVPFFFMKTG